jgi:hypothetical protein
MKSDLFLIVLITGTRGSVMDLKFLLETDGVCLTAEHHGDRHQAETVEELRKAFDRKLGTLVEIEEQSPGASVGLRTLGGDLYEALLPKELRSELERAAGSVDDDEVPVLRIHTDVPWIPWELMHDGQHFLGLRFQIARLPIISIAPDVSHPKPFSEPRTVKRICSFLGEHVLDSHLLDDWMETFSDLDGHNTQQCSYPALANGEVGTYPKSSDLEGALAEAHILHLTCHGIVDKNEVYWTLNEEDSDFWYNYEITEGHVKTWGREEKLAITKPLVFANACFSATPGSSEGTLGLTKGFGPRFLSHGAVAFVGTFAPVTKTLAVQFAHKFYQVLLGQAVSIGEALWQVKKAYAQNPPEEQKDSSWLFYCLYGHPDTRFELSSA